MHSDPPCNHTVSDWTIQNTIPLTTFKGHSGDRCLWKVIVGHTSGVTVIDQARGDGDLVWSDSGEERDLWWGSGLL